MCSLLASRLNVYRRGIPSTWATRQWRGASIHFWHTIRQEQPNGQANFLNYEDLAVSDIGSQQISLWSGEEHLGLIPVKEVINDYLSPGTMLGLRGDPPAKKSRAAPQSYDYEVRNLKTTSTASSRRGRPKRPDAKKICLDVFTSLPRLKNLLETSYRFLDPKTGVRNFPVEFHIKAHPRKGLTGLSTFTWGRVDLHPAVILRALPEGALQVVKPKVDLQRGEALWVVVPKDLRIGSVKLPNDPHEAASIFERIVIRKKEWLKEQIDVGNMTPTGDKTTQGQYNPPQKFMLDKQILEARGKGQDSGEKPKESEDGL
ncbi:hypothetical protein INS49_009273 [Diaporthe citri]|uniref:uncharacterized protein n=1 Tax=Diaporthe citri TaxID=83186 RepID=UPI001C8202B7|nr:uncharacterized protein INS49_009273 [Diaporthe citri]KAG6361053.1 hypothetical protein INS49_009273 [Diaporthe citri]